jgi:serine/threonine-protein kinase RsbW
MESPAKPPVDANTVRFSVQATLSEVARAVERLEHELPRRLDEQERYQVAIALAEVLTNIVEHGYENRGGPAIAVTMNTTDRWLAVEVRDAGLPIPKHKLEQAGPETSFGFDPTDLAALPEGGMGLGIIKTAFEYVDYRSQGGTNRLRLGKRLR